MNRASASDHQGMIALSVREMRMIVERLLLLTRMPAEFVPAIRDCALYSQAGGLAGLAALHDHFEMFVAADPGAIQIAAATKDRIVLDCSGQHAWVAAHSVLECALDLHRNGGGEVIVRNVGNVTELAVVEGLAHRHRARVSVDALPDGVRVRVCDDNMSGADEVLDRLLRDGAEVPYGLWRDLFARSNKALTPDSIESRRHAGPVMVDAEGRIHGRDDDDTDFSLLAANPQKVGSISREDA